MVATDASSLHSILAAAAMEIILVARLGTTTVASSAQDIAVTSTLDTAAASIPNEAVASTLDSAFASSNLDSAFASSNLDTNQQESIIQDSASSLLDIPSEQVVHTVPSIACQEVGSHFSR